MKCASSSMLGLVPVMDRVIRRRNMTVHFSLLCPSSIVGFCKWLTWGDAMKLNMSFAVASVILIALAAHDASAATIYVPTTDPPSAPGPAHCRRRSTRPSSTIRWMGSTVLRLILLTPTTSSPFFKPNGGRS